LYRIAGYRVCGERAVRVDILERLADLIRPALSWREGAPGPKPAAAFDGRGFTVTLAMTSLTGCSGEEFASILRSLGYRMDKRPNPPPPPPAVAAAPAEATTPTDATLPAPAADIAQVSVDAASTAVDQSGQADQLAAGAPIDQAAVAAEPASETPPPPTA